MVDNVRYENPLDLMRRQMQKQQEFIIPQAIKLQGVLCDIYRTVSHGSADRVYGGFSGQKLETTSSLQARVLGLALADFRSTKSDIISGWFEGGFCYALSEVELGADDVCVEVGTQVKFLVVLPEVIGTDGPRKVTRFRVTSLFE